MTLPLGVRYSILRNNVEVPLIPVDQLPFYIQGLPRELTPSRKHQESWRLVGGTQKSAVPVSIRAPSDLRSISPSADTNRQFLPPDHEARERPPIVSQDSKPLARTRPPTYSCTERPTNRLEIMLPEDHSSTITKDSSAASRSEGVQYPPHRLPNPSGVEPDPSKKEYCTHWIRTNSCDFMQQGCKYKHEMPDREKLKELGFAEIPKWYRDKVAIAAGASCWLRPRAAHDNNDRTLSIEPPASRAFRPSKLGSGRIRNCAAELSHSPAPRIDLVSAEVPNLIDLDGVPMATMSLPCSLSNSQSSGKLLVNVDTVVAQASGHNNKTVAFLLREKESEVKQLTDAPIDLDTPKGVRRSAHPRSGSALFVTDATPTNDVLESPASTLSQSMGTGLRTSREVSETSNTASETIEWERLIAKSSAPMGPGDRRNTRSSKSQQKRNPRPRKLADPADICNTPEKLAISKYAISRGPKEGHRPNKGPKRGEIQGEGKDPHFEIVLGQRTVREKQ